MRPSTLDQIVGQDATLQPLKEAVEKGSLQSVILWGPPGTGKTTVALALAREADAEFEKLSAVGSGVKDLREIIKRASQRQESGVGTVLFIDEIHRWDKRQQDALLPHVESGLITLVGATTENPGFEIRRALLSRSRLFKLRSLSEEEIREVLKRALNRGFDEPLEIEEKALDKIVREADGDARRALTALEAASALSEGVIEERTVERVLGDRQIGGSEDHFALISALIKSVRASDVAAGIYWLARLEASGEDPVFVARRLVILASEDIGIGSTSALPVAVAGFQAVERVGSPECWINLAHVVAHLSLSRKSWDSYNALNKARRLVAERPTYPVPAQLRNPSNALEEAMGYGKDYQHASQGEADHSFLPSELESEKIFTRTGDATPKR